MKKQYLIKKGKTNRLLLFLCGISVIIHLFIFYKVAQVYRKNNLSVIEVALFDTSRAPVRDIPRPRSRPKKTPHPLDMPKISKIITTQPHPSRLNPVKIEPYKADLPETLVEGIHIPESDIHQISGVNIAEWDPESAVTGASSGYSTPKTYLDLVRLRIERGKEYPESAKARQIEGSVTVHFTITKDGEISTAKIVKGSRHEILNAAAIKAIRNAAPFPKPPHQFFKGDISLELVISFMLS